MITPQSARKYEELLGPDVAPAPYDYQMLFKADGFFARQRAKQRFKLLKVVDTKLRRILRHEERVYFLTSGTTVTLSEHFFVGWIAQLLNMRALIFTTERVLLLQISGGKKKTKELVAQIPYTSIATVKSTWNGCCQVKLMDRTAYNFLSVPKADRKFLADFLGDMVRGTTAPFAPGARPAGVENLCPHCFTAVPGYPTACPSCSGAFKSAKTAGLLSFLFPGVGDWYLGHRGFALLELAGSCFLWFALVIAPLIGPPDPELGPPDAGYWTTAFIIVFVAHAIDGVMTHHFARKGHHPHGKPPAITEPPLVSPAK